MAELLSEIINEIMPLVQDGDRTVKSYEFIDGKRAINGYLEECSVPIAGHLVILAENQTADEPYMVCYCKLDTGLYYNIRTTKEYIEAMSLYAAGIQSFTQVLEKEFEKNGFPEALTAAECLPDGKNANYTGQLVIVDAKALFPEYRSSTSQLIECTHGNGARPNAIGRSVFGTELYSGASVVYDRSHILGVADECKLPQWAKAKLATNRDKKAAAGEPTKKIASMKPSLLDALDDAKAEAKQFNADHKAERVAKRGDKEVD
jgi:hypothetical protein